MSVKPDAIDNYIQSVMSAKDYAGILNNFDETGGRINIQCLPCSTCVCFRTGSAIFKDVTFVLDEERERLQVFTSDLTTVTPEDGGYVVSLKYAREVNLEADECRMLGGEKWFYGVARVTGGPSEYTVECYPQPSVCVMLAWK